MTGLFMRRIISLLSLLCCFIYAGAQDSGSGSSEKKSYIHMLHTNVTRFDEKINPDAWILVGDVQFRRDSMYMYCDSAHYFQKHKTIIPVMERNLVIYTNVT